MIDVLTPTQVREAEGLHATELADGTLMRRAAMAVAVRCAALLRTSRGRVMGARVVVLAGTGNNAGDALHAGAMLARRGCRVDAVLAGDGSHAEGLAALMAAGGRIRDAGDARALIDAADLVIDGLVGIGASGPLRPPADVLAALTHDTDAVVVAVDVPSGVDAATGSLLGDVSVLADVTVTFAAPKPGLLTGPGRAHAGAVVVDTIGIEGAVRQVAARGPSLRLVEGGDVRAWLPAPRMSDHKYRRGVVALAVGSPDYPGAAVLAASAASCGIAGMVMVLGDVPVPDIVPMRDVRDGGRARGWVAGSGWAEPDPDALRVILASDAPVVLDGGALTPEVVAMLAGRTAATVLTPHEGEFARICDAPLDDRVAAAHTCAVRTGAVVLLKGPGTVIAAPGGEVRIDAAGGPELAVAGSGDVLAGLLGALLATGPAPGITPLDAASAACWLHGTAGAIAGAGGRPVTASSIIAALPEAVARGRGGGRAGE